MKKIITLLLLSFCINNSYARYQTLEDSALSYDFYNSNISVNEDGSYDELVEFKITLLREQARSFAANYALTYNSDSENIKIIEAKTYENNVEHLVTDDMMEDKEIATNKGGFDSVRQLNISFPKPEVGAVIYLKYKINTKKVLIENEFSVNNYFGLNGFYKKASLIIDSKIPLKFNINDPHKRLTLVSSTAAKDKPNYITKAHIDLSTPFTNDSANELNNSSLNPKENTYASFTSFDSWEAVVDKLAPKYNSVIDQPLPELFSEIVESASKEKDTINQINKVTTMINEKIEYFGDWRTVNGKCIPRDLTVVAAKKSGDCKDFATMTTKILRMLGYKANVAWVIRGEQLLVNPNPLPNLGAFNHAMVSVVDKAGKIYWIDPTNIVSMSDGLFPDIAEKHVLVLEQGKDPYRKIPAVEEKHAKTLITTTISQDRIIDKKITLSGEKAIFLTSAELYLSKESLQDRMYYTFTSDNIEKKNRLKIVIEPQLVSRDVKPISIELKYKYPEVFSKTNLGLSYAIETHDSYSFKSILYVADDAINDLYLSHPRTIENKTIIKDMGAKDLHKLDFTISTPFISLSRKCYMKDKDTIIAEKFIIHKSWIKNEEFSSLEFKNLKRIIQKNFMNPLIILHDNSEETIKKKEESMKDESTKKSIKDESTKKESTQ